MNLEVSFFRASREFDVSFEYHPLKPSLPYFIYYYFPHLLHPHFMISVTYLLTSSFHRQWKGVHTLRTTVELRARTT